MGGILGTQLDGTWNILIQPLGFLIFFICALAETNRAPSTCRNAKRNSLVATHRVQQHEARLLPLRRIREHVHQQCGDGTLYFGATTYRFVHQAGIDSNWITLLGTARCSPR